MRVTLIHNPGAGDSGQDEDERLTHLIRAAGHTLVGRFREDDDAAFDDPGDLVAVAGGDGTVGRIARRMIGRDVPMTILPSGTANNVSKTLGLADLPLEQLIRAWQGAPVRRVDVGEADGPWGSRHFVEGVGAGLFARTMAEMDARDALAHIDNADDRIAHARRILRERLRTFPAIPMRLTLDGRDLSGAYLMLEVMNICFVGPNLLVAPACDPADGLFDVVLVPESLRDELEQHLATREGAPDLETRRGRHLRVESAAPVLHVDDETWPPEGARHIDATVPIDLRVEPGALRVLVPRT